MRRRFFVDQLTTTLPPDVSHHLAVLRLQAGTVVTLFARDGSRVQAEIVDAGTVRFVGDIEKTAWTSGITVAVPIVKGERQDWMIEKLCELGVDEWIPLLTERAVIRELGGGKRERMERLIVAASKQCGRDIVMRVGEVTPVSRVEFENAIVLDPRAATGIEDVKKGTVLFIGPEGGFTDKEVEAIKGKGGKAARIAPFILRAETAAIAATSVAMSAL